VKANALFAPDFCAGTKFLPTIPLGTSWPANEQGGLRSLNVVTDYPWIVDYQGRNLVAIASSQVNGFTEFLIPWKALYPSTGAPPITHASVGFVARIVDATGNLIADQTLPQDNDANPRRISQIAEVDVRVTPPSATAAPGYQGAVFYTMLVRSFQDSTGDGHGDLNGLSSRLDYLNDGNPATTTDLGVDALWLMPIFQSPSYHGYDATNYDLVQPAYGTLADFQALADAAHQRGIKVYLDLALNHTSDQHPWFVDSASSPGAAHRDWYVWSPTDPGWTQPWSTDPVWHPRNGAWYYGLFFTALPDLNYRNTAVRDEMKRVAAQWIQRGADGYRLDATPYLIEDGPGPGQQHTPGTHQYLKEIRDHIATFNPNAAVVAENWTDTETIARYYGKRTTRGGDEVQMSFDFPLSDRIIESLFTQNAVAVATKLVELRAAYPFGAVDAPFLRNHDQDRIATVIGSDPPRLGLAAAILLTVPGTPFIYYGDELGAQSSAVGGDEAKRAPMAWDATPGAGFTAGAPWSPLAPGQSTANVASQTGDPASLLSRYRQLIRARRSSPALAAGQGLEMLTPMFGFNPLLVFVRTDGTERVVVAHNLSSIASSDAFPLRAGSLQPLFVDPGATASEIVPGSWVLSLPPYGTAAWREQP
jgi:glycosidase